MGQEQSQLDRPTNGDPLPVDEHYLGLANFGNTCYANSVIQALYFCKPFREKVLAYKEDQLQLQQQQLEKKDKAGAEGESLLSVLGDLFVQIATYKKKFGVIHPKRFITKVKKENIIFNNMQQQDAHEFLNYLLNTIADLLEEERKAQDLPPKSTWIHDIFQGTLVNETKCLCCETVRSKEEDFLDLSVDVEQNTSLTHCLKDFSSSETLSMECKYYCEECCSKQEATKRLRIKKLPQILAFHLKRFKYLEYSQRYTKLSYRVVFPWELKLFNTSDDAENPDRMYDLVAIVVHCGSGPNRGHYITIVKSHGFWLLFDDEIMEEIEPHTIENFFGLTDSQRNSPNESGYILFYQSRE